MANRQRRYRLLHSGPQPALAAALTAEFGKGFDATNLWHIRRFFLAFPILDALRRELSWTHYRMLLRVESNEACQWYMNEAATQGWTTRALERQLGTLYYERLLASADRKSVEQEALANIAPLQQTPREFVRDPVMLEFLGLPRSGKLLESDLEQGIARSLAGVFAGTRQGLRLRGPAATHQHRVKGLLH